MQASEYFDIVWSLLPVTPRLVMGIKHGMSPMTPSDSLQESPLTWLALAGYGGVGPAGPFE